ncbi:MAG: HAD family hydrolase [Nanoarchaeota archaeon]
MLLIFDLDDTLVDTSGSTVPIKLKEALEVMINAGLRAGSFGEALNLLYGVDESSPNGEETIRRFLQKINADSSFFALGIKGYTSAMSEETEIKPLEGAVEVLYELKQKNVLALVSKGKEDLQYQKMMKAGIDKDIFAKIIITQDYNKRDKYQIVMEELHFTPKNTMVIGDKFYSDLLPAKELGITTVQMLWGRALKFPEEGADYKITQLAELKKLVQELRP